MIQGMPLRILSCSTEISTQDVSVLTGRREFSVAIR